MERNAGNAKRVFDEKEKQGTTFDRSTGETPANGMDSRRFAENWTIDAEVDVHSALFFPIHAFRSFFVPSGRDRRSSPAWEAAWLSSLMRRSGSWRAKFEGLEEGFREEKSVCEQGRKTKEGRETGETGEADAGRENGPVDVEWEEKGVRTPRKSRTLQTVGKRSRVKTRGKLCCGHSFDKYISVHWINSDSVWTPASNRFCLPYPFALLWSWLPLHVDTAKGEEQASRIHTYTHTPLRKIRWK